MKNLIDYLPSEYSWWYVENGGIYKLNNTKATKENLRIIFKCSCHKHYHVATLGEIKRHQDGDYDFCCPDNNNLEEMEEYVELCRLPLELESIFEKSTFENNF